MIYDTYYQITQFYPRGDEVRAELWAVPGRRAYAQFSDHHPIFDTLLLVLTKKTGIYIVIPTMVVYAVVYRRVWWRSLVPAALSVALMWGVMPNVVFPALDVVPGGRQEMLGTLFQQTARYVALHGVEMSASERRAIDDVLVVDTLNERYQSEWADSVKYEYNASATDEQIQEYLKVWAAPGLRHPGVYVEATLSMLSGFASPSEPIQLRIETWDEDHDGTSLLRQPWQLEGLREAARDVWDA